MVSRRTKHRGRQWGWQRDQGWATSRGGGVGQRRPKGKQRLVFPCLSPAVLVVKDTLVSVHGLCTCGIPGRQLALHGGQPTFCLPSPQATLPLQDVRPSPSTRESSASQSNFRPLWRLLRLHPFLSSGLVFRAGWSWFCQLDWKDRCLACACGGIFRENRQVGRTDGWP